MVDLFSHMTYDRIILQEVRIQLLRSILTQNHRFFYIKVNLKFKEFRILIIIQMISLSSPYETIVITIFLLLGLPNIEVFDKC